MPSKKPALRRISGYMSSVHCDPANIIEQARDALKGVRYDTMVGTGLSGALIVPTLARAFDKHWCIVRKDNDGTHSSHMVEGSIGSRWLFVDDIIATGSTLRRVQMVLQETCERAIRDWEADRWITHPTKYVGAYLYQDGDFERPKRAVAADF